MKKLFGAELLGALLLSLSVALFNPLNAQSTDVELTLDEAIELALANNPEIKRALLAIEDSDALVTIAYSGIYPDISSSLNYTRNIELPVSYLPGEIVGEPAGTIVPVAFGTDNDWSGGFTVNQTLFRGETLIGLSTATIFKTVQQEVFRASAQQIVTQARIAYYQILAAQEQFRLQEIQIERLEQNLEENQKREEAGLVDSYAVLQLQVQLSNQEPLLIEAQYAVREAIRNMNLIMGLPYSFEFETVGNLNQFDIVDTEATAQINAHIQEVDQMNPFTFSSEIVDSISLAQNRGDLRVLEANLDLKDREITAVRSRFLPTLEATYNLQWSASEPGSPTFFENANRFQILGFNLSMPLFQGFSRNADVQRVLISRKDLEEQVRATSLLAQNEVASSSEDLNMAFETASARKIALEQAQEGYERAQLRLENGLGSQLEVTDAEVQVRQAEVNYAIMVYNYLTAKAQYDLATGVVPFVDTQISE